MHYAVSLKGEAYVSKTLEKVPDNLILDDDFNLAFKLVFFDENDEGRTSSIQSSKYFQC